MIYVVMNEGDSTNLNRREMLKRTGFAGVGFTTLNQSDLGQFTENGSVHLVEAGLEYQVDLPETVNETLSVFKVDVRPIHGVDTANKRVRPSAYANDEEKSKLKDSRKLLWLSDSYYQFPSETVQSSVKNWIPLSLSSDFRPVAGIHTVSAHSPPSFSVQEDHGDIVVTTGTKERTVAVGERTSIQFDSQTMNLKTEKPTDGPIPETKEVSVTAVPELKIRNNGSLDLYNGENNQK